jgi:shikimate kinase
MSMIALVGLPGSGKSTISRQLGRLLQYPVLDTDAVIEEFIGCSIGDYFAREGIVLRPENRQALHDLAYTVYLHAQPEQLFWRLKNDRSRPLLQNTDMQAKLHTLYAQRHSLYQAVARCQVDAVGHSPQAVAQDIVQMYQKFGM